jgi:hypothetical protein
VGTTIDNGYMQVFADIFKPEKMHLLYTIWDSIKTCYL